MTELGTFLALAVSVSRQRTITHNDSDMIAVSILNGGYRYLRVRVPETGHKDHPHDHVVYVSIAKHATDRTIIRVHDANGEHRYSTTNGRDVILRYTKHLLTLYKGDSSEVDQ